jgi:gliding motility-associated-like protein
MKFIKGLLLSLSCLLMTSIMAQPCSDFVVTGEIVHENPCGIGPNGSIYLNIIGGTEPYSITWTNGPVDVDSIFNLSAGSYGVTVTDSNNCIAVAGFQVLLTDTMSFADLSIYPSCDGDSGTGIISVSGGNPPYDYLWSSGSTDSIAPNLAVGTHSVTVTDQSNCIVTMDVVIVTNPELEVYPIVNNPECFNDYGDVSLFIIGGAPPYQIDWQGVDSSAVLPGTYQVEVTDISMCSKTVTYHILSEPEITVDLTTSLVDCATGMVEVSAVAGGGTPPLTIDWNGLDTMAVLPGIHPFSISDSEGCSLLDTLVIDAVDSITTVLNIGDLSCGQDSTLADIEISGGIDPYIISWSSSSSDSLSSPVIKGMNWVKIEDSRGCIYIDTFNVISPDLFDVTFDIEPTNCNFPNGQIVVHVNGGSGNFNVYLDDLSVDTILNNLSEGTYDLSIVDVNGCDLDTTLSVPSMPHFYLSNFEVIQNTCWGGNEGSISVEFDGVQDSLELTWNTGDTSLLFLDSLVAGQYTLFASDGSGCNFDTTFVLDQVPALFITSAVKYDPCDEDADKYIRIVPNGGTPPYEILWDDDSTDSTLYIDHTGTYTVALTDSNGCERSFSIIAKGDVIGGEYCFKIPNAFSPNGDLINDVWVISGLEEKPGNTLKVFDRWGKLLLEESNYQSDWDGTVDGNDLPMGSYFYVLDLGDGANVFDGSISIKR